MRLFDIFKTRQQQKEYSPAALSFYKHLEQFNELYKKADKLLKSVNNLYWCIDIGLEYEMPTIKATTETMNAYYEYVSQMIPHYNAMCSLHSRNSEKFAEYEDKFIRAKNNYNAMFELVDSMINRYITLNVDYRKCEQFDTIIDGLEKAEAKLKPEIEIKSTTTLTK